MANPAARPNPSAAPSRPHASAAPSTAERRGFMAKAAAVVIGGVRGAGARWPAAWSCFSIRLRRKAAASKFVPRGHARRACPTTACRGSFRSSPSTSTPGTARSEPIGAVYLRRTPGPANARVPDGHLPARRLLRRLRRAIEHVQVPLPQQLVHGRRRRSSSPAPAHGPWTRWTARSHRQEVLVKFENFYTGKTDKVAKA